jgi:hypothetical protein
MSEMIDDDPVGQASVKRWRRFGMDRLYVNEADSRAIGWFDLQTGEQEIKSAARVELFERTVAEWLGAHPGMGPSNGVELPSGSVGQVTLSLEKRTSSSQEHIMTAHTAVTPAVSDDDASWTDLAQNGPGQAVRAQAIAEQREQPVVTWIARVLGVHTTERAWRMGEKGEELVAKELARLPEGWHVLHSIRVGDSGADIDHLVIGRAGVFSLNTKHHRNASIWVARNVFMVNGQRQPYIRNSRHEAERVARILSRACGTRVDVHGVVVVVNADSFTIKEPPVDVKVLYRLQLRRWLREQSWVLDEASVERIFEAARRSSTWSGKL